MQTIEICVCETWNLRLQSSKLASMLRTHNLCAHSIHNLSTLHKVLKSLLVRHQIVPPILKICADCPHTLSLQHAISCNRTMSYFRYSTKSVATQQKCWYLKQVFPFHPARSNFCWWTKHNDQKHRCLAKLSNPKIIFPSIHQCWDGGMRGTIESAAPLRGVLNVT